MDKIADRIAKLLAKAESTDSPHEAEILSEKAAELMIKYNIEQARIDERRRTSGQTSEPVIQVTIRCAGRWAMPMRHLVFRVIAVNEGIQGYYSRTGGRNGECVVYLVGFQSQVEQVKLLCLSLMLQAVAAMKVFTRNHPDRHYLSSSEMWREGKGFLEGYGVGVQNRMLRSKRTVEAEVGSTGKELMLARDAHVKSWIEEHVGKLGAGRASNASASGYSYASGREEGAKADTGNSRVGAGDRTQINA